MDPGQWRGALAPLDEHPWVLVTAGPDDERASRVAAQWTERGHEVFTCSGPTAGHSCPMVDMGVCPVVEHAHAVINALDPAIPDVAVLLNALALRYLDLPIVALA